ncbi:MAG: ABC transporter permease [Acidimicrobiaceae bacterium]|nr:ABC transporter permease [Acidimicrobiaceae bacterium]
MKRNRTLFLGVSLVSFSVVMALLSIFWTPYDPLEINPDSSLAKPSWSHLLGADVLGRDVLSNILVGSRTTLITAFLAVMITMVLGVIAGISASVSPRWFKSPAIYGIDIVLALPTVLFAIVLAAIYGPSTLTAVVAIGIATAAAVAQVTRREVNVILTSDFVIAAYASGSGKGRIIRRHILPNIRASLFIQASGASALAILAESTLSYLGLGTTPPAPSWGRMMASSQQYLLIDPIVALWPGFAIVITVLGFNLLGDGLREALDPTLRSSKL